MNLTRTLLFAFMLSSLSGCGIIFGGINAAAIKYFPDDYVFTRPDGTTYRLPHLAKDRRSKLKDDSVYLRKFDLSASTIQDTILRRRTHMELTVPNLKQIASRNQLTIFVEWDPGCGGDLQFTTSPTMRMLKQLRETGFKFNQGQIGLVFGSVTYQLSNIDYFFNKWHYPYQSFIIPSDPYSDKIFLKEIFFNRELYPEEYANHKDDIHKFKIFLLSKDGQVIDKVAYSLDEATFTNELDRFAKSVKASIHENSSASSR